MLVTFHMLSKLRRISPWGQWLGPGVPRNRDRRGIENGSHSKENMETVQETLNPSIRIIRMWI